MTKPWETPLRRWSRVKRDRQTLEAKPDDQLHEASAPPPIEPKGPLMGGNDPSHTIAPVDEDAQLPDIESLDKDSDFTVFLTENVPEELRRRALRSLWRSDPILANLDGLNDYDEDYSTVGTVRDVVRTVYEAGKGYLTKETRAQEDNQIEMAADTNEPQRQTGPDEPAGSQDDDQAALAGSAGDDDDTCSAGREGEPPST